MKTILFVCTGNVCRSPMAEGWFRHLTRGRGDFQVYSAGIGAVDGHSPTPHATMAMLEAGVDISEQRSRSLTADLVQQADFILCMTQSHVDSIHWMYPWAEEKTFVLREFDDSVESFEKEISDPIGSSFDVYEDCRDQIQQGILAFLKFMEQNDVLRGITTKAPAVAFALGADHGGFELKQELKKHLEQKGLSVKDFGASTNDPGDDYPDFARPVAEAVSNGGAEFGLLICTSGVGMSIAANKTPGVRAALISDATTAGLCRQHNDVNVLCLAGKRTSAALGRDIVV